MGRVETVQQKIQFFHLSRGLQSITISEETDIFASAAVSFTIVMRENQTSFIPMITKVLA